MPKPIEPSPITAMRGFVDEDMQRFPVLCCGRHSVGGLAFGYHGLAALSVLPEIDPRAALPPMAAYYLMKCGATALVPYYRPGDPAVTGAIKGLAGKYSSVLLANHGPVVSGDTLQAAVFAIEELEETAKLYLLLRGLNPRYLSPEQVADLSKTFGLVSPDTHDHT